MKQKTAIITLTLAAIILSTLTLAAAQTYNNVTTITGSSDQTTNYFTIPSSEWRITWSYTPSSAYPNLAIFSVYAYPKNEPATNYATSIYESGASQTNGITYIHQGQKDYYLQIIAANLQDYTINIEAQPAATTAPTNNPTPTPTIPETTTTIAVIALLITSISIIRIAKRKQKT